MSNKKPRLSEDLKPSAKLDASADVDDTDITPWQPSPLIMADPSSIVNASLLTPDSKAQLRDAFSTSCPYQHCVLRDVFDAAVLRAVRDEIVHNVQVCIRGS